MNRRNFMGSMVAGVTAAQILKMPLPLDRSTLTPIPRVQWLKNGLIYGAGSHETYLFLVRRGSPPLNLRQAYDWKQSEMFIRQLKDLGAELFYTHLYKGFGMAAAMPEMEQTKRAAAIAHGYGMRVGTYIQWDTMMYETFFAEEPRAEHWIQRDPNGLPIGLTYGYQQSFRYRPCFTHQEYVDYLKTKIVRYAVEEVKTDYIFFDNFDLNPEPDSCHCPVCVKGFRVFLKTKYTPEKRRERFGFENVDYVNPPLWNRQNPPERMEIIQDPAFQEWVDFRCQVMADALRQMAEYAKSLNAEVAIAINCHAISGENRPWTWGTDHRRLFTSTDLFATDDRIKAEYLPDGRLATEIRSYKVARAFNNVLLTSHPEEVEVAEGLAFNQSFGSIDETVGTDMGGVMSTKPHPISPMLAKYLAFYRKNRDLYVGAKDLATVGSLRSYASITYHQWTAQMSALLVEQTLIQARIPFHLIFDEPLPDFSKLKVLILPGSECLSEEQIGKIRAFVKGGGGLVATGATGLYDEWYRPRVEPALKGLVEGQRMGQAYQESVRGGVPAPSGFRQRKQYGQGRVVYIPQVEYDGPLPAPEPYFAIPARYWKRPRNWEEIAEAVRWAANSDMPLDVAGPDFLAANLVGQMEKRRKMIHLVNYDGPRSPFLSGIDATCRLPEGRTAQSVKLLRPEQQTELDLPFKAESNGVSFTVPEIAIYAVVVVAW